MPTPSDTLTNPRIRMLDNTPPPTQAGDAYQGPGILPSFARGVQAALGGNLGEAGAQFSAAGTAAPDIGGALGGAWQRAQDFLNQNPDLVTPGGTTPNLDWSKPVGPQIEQAAADRFSQTPIAGALGQANEIRKTVMPTIFDPGFLENEQRTNDLAMNALEKRARGQDDQVTPEEQAAEQAQTLRVAGLVNPAPGGVAAAPLGLGRVGESLSRVGRTIASALGPTENLPAGPVRDAIVRYANVVGRQADAATVLAENQFRRAGANLTVPAVQDVVRQTANATRDQAARDLVADLQAQGMATIRDQAPQGWRSVTDDPNAYLGRYAFDPALVGPISAVTDQSAIATNPLGRAVLRAIGTAKGTIFSLSNFHTVTEGLNAAFSSPETLGNFARAFASDTFAQGLRGAMADTIDNAARAGVTGLAARPLIEDVGVPLANRLMTGGVGGAGGAAAGYVSTKLAGGSDEEARANALKLGAAGAALGGIPLGRRGTLAQIQQSALFERAVPLAKATAWDGLVRGGMDPAAAAAVVNERFGGLNYAAMGRSPTMLDAQRLSIMASDWNEATVRQLGSAIFGGNGQGVRAGFLARTIGGMLAATEVLNFALSGHSTIQNQPGHQFEVETSDPRGGYMHFGILPGNVQAYLNLANTEVADPSKRGTAPVNFVAGRLSTPLQVGLDLARTASGVPPFQVAKAGAAGWLERLAPVGLSQVAQSVLEGGQNPAAAIGLAAAGVNPRYQSAGGGGSGGFVSPPDTSTSTSTRPPPPARSSGSSSGAPRPAPPHR
jgi:hypothetical protein